jgi:hypothetical protein
MEQRSNYNIKLMIEPDDHPTITLSGRHVGTTQRLENNIGKQRTMEQRSTFVGKPTIEPDDYPLTGERRIAAISGHGHWKAILRLCMVLCKAYSSGSGTWTIWDDSRTPLRGVERDVDTGKALGGDSGDQDELEA